MKIIVTDRIGIETGVLVKSLYVVISIHDPDKPKANVKRQSGLRDTLFVSFHDAEPVSDKSCKSEVVYMTAEHSQKIIKYADHWREQIGTIVVHCEQGMSRSPAVAAALSKRYGLDTSRYFLEYQPNQYVYELLCKEE